jgi:penicillin-binding protein 1C
MRRLRTWLLVCLAVICGWVSLLVTALSIISVPESGRLGSASQLVTAENGEILRGYLTPDGYWRLATRLEDVDRRYLDVLLAYEDRRFFKHSGVDILAVARVAKQLLQHGRVVSGASTLTMQVVRLLNPGLTGPRGKILQMLGALRLERSLSKREILEIYLNLAPFGGNVEGVRTASLFYFGKEPTHLTLNQAALLVAVAQSPTRRRPDRHPSAALAARDRVLDRVAGRIPASDRPEPEASLALISASRPALAAHFADRVRRQTGQATIRTTIDIGLQTRIEQLVRDALNMWPDEVNAAVLVVRNADFAARAYAGGDDFFSREDAGQFDHVRSVRSPGSTLKPIIYGLGFEALIIHPSTIVTDAPVNFDGYAPQNFNEGFQGDMTVREALIKSINTTAVAVLARISPAGLLARLRNVDVPIKVDSLDAQTGLAVALGGGGMTLESLTRLYAGIANKGRVRRLKVLADDPNSESTRLLPPDVAWALADILADVPPPNGFGQRNSGDGGRRIAYKTGTSFGYRDAWAVGFDRDHTVGVWIGRSDGAPNPGALGATAAAPLLYRIFDLLPTPHHDVAGAPLPNSAFANRLTVPQRLQRWAPSPGKQQVQLLRIVFPQSRSVVVAENDADGTSFVPLSADGGEPPYFWFVDGVPLPDRESRVRWRPPGPGPVSASLMDSKGFMSAVEFWVR